ncbi:CobW family GTP-binding protein [Aliisedimentitalea scapharcae]|uniref:CobW family GTP-binding protein n=1 Tax=Aliisedimentitalea scapharcae TaxID=1524259 RepID=A0ABZ2XU61_9RHOB|nr:GTP-binding protein [Rhodobacteraceae bacterium M382]
MMRMPVTVISGYLGAGKTTLINQLLSEDHGMNLTVVVNDFGAINIDADLIARADGDQIALTNGCVCCTMGNDLTLALKEALNRSPRPDHLLIEASGIADPAAIANTASDDPDLGYAGIVTLVDADNIFTLLEDPLIAPQVTQQIKAADLVLISKSDEIDARLSETLTGLGARHPVLPVHGALSDLLLDVIPLPKGHKVVHHPGYTTWQHTSDLVLDRRALGDKLADRPEGLYRLKGFVQTTGGGYELHIVGRNVDARRVHTDKTVLVALGPTGRISSEEIEAWWSA